MFILGVHILASFFSFLFFNFILILFLIFFHFPFYYFSLPSLHEFLLYSTYFELKEPIKVNTEKKKSPKKIFLGVKSLYNKLPTVESDLIFLQNLYKNQKY